MRFDRIPGAISSAAGLVLLVGIILLLFGFVFYIGGTADYGMVGCPSSEFLLRCARDARQIALSELLLVGGAVLLITSTVGLYRDWGDRLAKKL